MARGKEEECTSVPDGRSLEKKNIKSCRISRNNRSNRTRLDPPRSSSLSQM